MILKIKPVFKEKIWGGTKLFDEFEIKNRASFKNVGEAWVVSGYQGSESTIVGEKLKLNEFFKTHRKFFDYYPSENFPLLVKIINPAEDLSIQVHPNDLQAQRLDNYEFGKTEAWYILDAKKDQKIIIGTNAKNKEELLKDIKEKNYDTAFKIVDCKVGDVFNIIPGTIHAIKGGTTLYEIQQSSDLTYRLNDYDRKGFDGKPRELHLKKGIEVVNFFAKNTNDRKFIKFDDNILIESVIRNNRLDLDKITITGPVKYTFNKEKHFLIVTVASGQVIINNLRLNKYESIIITIDSMQDISFDGDAILLVGNPI